MTALSWEGGVEEGDFHEDEQTLFPQAFSVKVFSMTSSSQHELEVSVHHLTSDSLITFSSALLQAHVRDRKNERVCCWLSQGAGAEAQPCPASALLAVQGSPCSPASVGFVFCILVTSLCSENSLQSLELWEA